MIYIDKTHTEYYMSPNHIIICENLKVIIQDKYACNEQLVNRKKYINCSLSTS